VLEAGTTSSRASKQGKTRCLPFSCSEHRVAFAHRAVRVIEGRIDQGEFLALPRAAGPGLMACYGVRPGPTEPLQGVETQTKTRSDSFVRVRFSGGEVRFAPVYESNEE